LQRSAINQHQHNTFDKMLDNAADSGVPGTFRKRQRRYRTNFELPEAGALWDESMDEEDQKYLR